MILDLHTHIMPEMDDGANSVSESLEMLKLCSKAGIDTVFLTPHFYPTHENPEEFFERRNKRFSKLTEALRENEGAWPKLFTGAELRYFSGISEYEGLKEFCLGKTDYILIEMPFNEWTASQINEILNLALKGYRPILAHVERYLNFTKTKALDTLAAGNVCFQINAESLQNRRIQKIVNKFESYGWNIVVASDCHNLTNRCPNLDTVPLKYIDSKQNEWLENLEYSLSVSGDGSY